MIDGTVQDDERKPIILFAGYSRANYIKEVRDRFGKDFRLGCIYRKDPLGRHENECLKLFDFSVNIKEIQNLSNITSNVSAITNTRERDADLYIDLLFKCGLINEEQMRLYHISNDKSGLKEFLQDKMPNLQPKQFTLGSNDLPFPVVLKPSGLCGSLFTKIVYDREQLISFVKENNERIIRIGRDEFDRDVSFMIEEFIEGRQYSVNAYINSSGQPILCPIVRVIPAFELGIDDTYSVFQYVDPNFPKNEMHILNQVISELVANLKIRSTSAHFDMVKSKDGWKLLDMGLRIGSLRQDLFKQSHSMNHIQNDILNRIGLEPNVPDKQKLSSCIVTKASSRQGILQNINIPEMSSEKTFVVGEEYDIKTEMIGKKVGPVNLGGTKLTKHLVIGESLDEVLFDSRRLFNSMSFSIGEITERSSKKLVKKPDVITEGELLIKRRKPEELEVEKKVLNFLKNNPKFKVPKIVNERTNASELATEYIPGMSLTRFFYLLDMIKEDNRQTGDVRRSSLELKEILIDKMIGDLVIFQGFNSELLKLFGEQIHEYPYETKLQESFDAIIDSFDILDYGLKSNEMSSVRADLRTLAEYLTRNSDFAFRDSTTNNVLINEPELDSVRKEEAIEFIISKLAKPDGFEYFKDLLYHVDFATANYLVTRADDVIHVLEHESCSLGAIAPKNKEPVVKGELYYSTMVARMFRFLAREIVHFAAGVQYHGEGFEMKGSRRFYLDKTLNALSWLDKNSSGSRLEHLNKFVSGIDKGEFLQ